MKDNTIDAVGIDRAVILTMVREQYGNDYYEKIKKVWDEYPKERYYIKMSVEYFSIGRQSVNDCRRQLDNVLRDYHMIEEN